MSKRGFPRRPHALQSHCLHPHLQLFCTSPPLLLSLYLSEMHVFFPALSLSLSFSQRYACFPLLRLSLSLSLCLSLPEMHVFFPALSLSLSPPHPLLVSCCSP